VTTAVAADVTLPGYLVEIGFPSPFRASSRGDVTWSGGIFIASGFTVSGLGGDEVTLRFFDADVGVTTLILTYGIENLSVKLWGFYAEAPAYDDVFPLFEGRGVGADGNTATGATVVRVGPLARESPYVPRLYATRENGFNWLPPAGKIITFGGERFELVDARG
jgi:hypothetical protein